MRAWKRWGHGRLFQYYLVLLCLIQGHNFRAYRADPNERLLSVCDRCSLVLPVVPSSRHHQ